MKYCCFVGHRKIEISEKLIKKVTALIESLIQNKAVSTFLFGSRSEFDDLCYKIVSKLKEKYPYIKRIFVRGEYEYINNQYKNYLLESYEDTFYPAKIHGAGRLSYVLRNQAMIDASDFCIFYYRKDYKLISTTTKSGTMTAFNYAQKKKKQIFII